ncbi:MAG: ectonucleotide pyrophosphatase/phosphodiesterase [Gemmatimonadetes bacterium]|nr:ectonucleotide pyrophosphatase/phosphodiesterase [Gemmatimonadota bacterium]
MKRAARAGWLPVLLVSTLGATQGGLGVPVVAAPDGNGPRTRHVVVISVDGLRPDAIERFELRTLGRLVREGSSAIDARTILPSKTLPSHTSMLTGLLPEDHGITFNREMGAEENVSVPTIFELAREHGLSTAAFFSKAKFRHLQRPDAYDYWQAPGSNADNWLATRTVADAVQYLRHERPNLLFVHIGEPDYAGHTTGWMSIFYGWAARRADAGVARVLEAADDAFGRGGYTVILTADHGGHEHGHGTEVEEDVRIPWIAWGAGVTPGSRPAGVRTMDTAATALWLLGVPHPAHWEGRPVRSAFGVQGQALPVAAGS